MFIINQSSNSISPLSKPSFSELGFKERQHLQEWIAKHPSSLGEKLLIIQKEFDGWDETNERLDLLALDMEGGLVVIENKLDDSGKDVVWQSLKYAAYCSTLKKENVIDLFRKYLGSQGVEAEDRLSSFFGVDDLEDVEINEGANQRIILVAANFRREVTATCLWLLERQIDMRCIRATPFRHENSLFLSLDQIIPPPEAHEYMIKVGSKKVEENSTRNSSLSRHKRRQEFWTLFLDSLTGTPAEIYSGRTPTIDSWLGGKTGYAGIRHNVAFTLTNIRYEFHLGSNDKSLNERRFDELYANKGKIEEAFGSELIWDRNENWILSRIYIVFKIDGSDKNNWESMINWASEKVECGINTFTPWLDTLNTIKFEEDT